MIAIIVLLLQNHFGQFLCQD